MKIAFLCCAETLTTSPTRRPDAFEHDHQIAALREGMGDRSKIIELDWRAPIEDFASVDLAILGTTWDYTEHKDEFIAKLEAMELRSIRVCNASEIVRWNADKAYLEDLEKAGAPSIPTIWVDHADAQSIQSALTHFDCEKIVAKRAVGAGAVGQSIFSRENPPPEDWVMAAPALLQPFLPSIQTEGEFSFLFIDGEFSHALLKQAKSGEYRIQSLYGGTEVAITPSKADLDAARSIMALLPFVNAPLYARIDMVRRDDGALCVIEAELIEPYLYPLQGKNMGRMLADAILRRV